MSKPRILVAGPMMAFILAELDERYSVHRLWLESDQAKFLKEEGKNFEVLVTNAKAGASKELMSALPLLKAVIAFGVGLDQIDLDHARSRGIIVTNTSQVLDDCVADTALALLLATSRRIAEADRFVRSGRWSKETFPLGMKFTGKKCGIAGLGNIGKAIATRLEGFGVEVSYFGRQRKKDLPYKFYDDLSLLAADVDFLVLALNGGKETFHIVDAKVLTALGPKGILINIARGSVVDEAALVKALQNSEILGAGLDVYENEPLPAKALTEMHQVVLLPHIASATRETRQAMGEVVLDNLSAFFAGSVSRLRSVVP
ncbi:MAG: 2-hydroxyacid dehydrogenase [Proteobacteria bacterium]|nr:MAG: 2-hydroxyacid dehydrogenase [Pseudomonadota bacterium]